MNTEPLSSENEIETLTAEKPKKEDDGILNILLIGSSFAYRFPDELCGMAETLGIQMRVYHAYYSGLTLEVQWQWYRTNTGEYEPNLHKTSGITEMKRPEGSRLKDYLTLYDWDIISVHQTPIAFRTGDVEEARRSCSYAKPFYEYIRGYCPDARYMWYQIWGINVGYVGSSEATSIQDVAKQTAMYESARILAHEMSRQNAADLVPAGDAWQIIRGETDIGDRLTGRDGTEYGDNLHDGNTGGGEYLNACVWFEVLFAKSCVGNTWRPSKYNLDEAKIPLLQDAAHRAVAGVWGDDYAK